MRKIAMKEIIGRALTRTSQILFSPFSLKKWFVLAFIALFAGALSMGGNGAGGGGPGKAEKKAEAQTVRPAAVAGQASNTVAGKRSIFPAQAADAAKAFAPIAVAAVGCFAAAAFVFYLWIACRFKFIWFNAVVSNDASIVEPFHRHTKEGNSLFKASLTITLVFLALFLATGGWALINAFRAGAFAQNFEWSASIAINLFAGPAVLGLILLFLAVVVSVAVEHFAVIYMALDKSAFMPAIKKVMGMYNGNAGDIILFYLVLTFLTIVCGVIAGIVALIGILVFIIAGGILALIGYLLFMAALKMKIVFIAYCVILGVPLLALLLVFLILSKLPFAVFLRAYSIEYMCALDCGYDYDALARYSGERTGQGSKGFVLYSSILAVVTALMLIVALFTAIAVPNFAKAREAAALKNSRAQAGSLQSR